MCGEKIIGHSRTMGTGAFSEIEIDTTRGGPEIRQLPSFAFISLSNRRFNVGGGHPKHLFICARGSYAARCLVSRAR